MRTITITTNTVTLLINNPEAISSAKLTEMNGSATLDIFMTGGEKDHTLNFHNPEYAHGVLNEIAHRLNGEV